jgi:hypothetical protein
MVITVNPMVMGTFFIVMAYTLQRHTQKSVPKIQQTTNLVVNTTCARRVQTENVKTLYHTVWSHLP